MALPTDKTSVTLAQAVMALAPTNKIAAIKTLRNFEAPLHPDYPFSSTRPFGLLEAKRMVEAGCDFDKYARTHESHYGQLEEYRRPYTHVMGQLLTYQQLSDLGLQAPNGALVVPDPRDLKIKDLERQLGLMREEVARTTRDSNIKGAKAEQYEEIRRFLRYVDINQATIDIGGLRECVSNGKLQLSKVSGSDFLTVLEKFCPASTPNPGRWS